MNLDEDEEDEYAQDFEDQYDMENFGQEDGSGMDSNAMQDNYGGLDSVEEHEINMDDGRRYMNDNQVFNAQNQNSYSQMINQQDDRYGNSSSQ